MLRRGFLIVAFITCSTCASYAVMIGDVDNDDSVDPKDTISSLKMLSGSQDAVSVVPESDINRDGKVGIQEAIYSLRNSTKPLINQAEFSGEPENGAVVTLSGSGFGPRFKKDDPDAPYAPLLNGSFEYDSNEDPTMLGTPVVESLPEWADRGREEDHPRKPGFERRALFSDVLRSSESTNNRSIKLTHIKSVDGTADPVIVAQNLDFKKSGKIFFSYWVKFKWPNANPNIAYQYKLSTVVTDVYGSGNVPRGASMQLANWMYLKDGVPYTKSAYRNNNGGESIKSNAIYFAKDALEPTTDNWRQIVLFWAPGPADEFQGKIWSWISKGKGSNLPIVQLGGLDKFYYDDEEDHPMLASYDDGGSDFPNSIKLAWYLSLLSEWNVDTYFDDVVADNSWAQIFIGDKPQFNDCTQLELQQVVDWQVGENGADDVAQFQLRYGSLPKNTPLYIYILNENGLFTGVGFEIPKISE